MKARVAKRIIIRRQPGWVSDSYVKNLDAKIKSIDKAIDLSELFCFNMGFLPTEVHLLTDRKAGGKVGSWFNRRFRTEKFETMKASKVLKKAGGVSGENVVEGIVDMFSEYLSDFLSGEAQKLNFIVLGVIGPAPVKTGESKATDDVYEGIIEAFSNMGLEVSAQELSDLRPQIEIVVKDVLSWARATEKDFWIQ